jgi:xanthine dehydrogenase accessory factor
LSGRTAIVRGGGDLATGIIYRLWKARYKILCLETELPLTVRGPVSAATAVFEGRHVVEDMPAVLIGSLDEWEDHTVVVLVDPEGKSIGQVGPDLVVDAIMAKCYTGTNRTMAPLVLAIGPGFSAPDQVHGVVETKRGHYLGRLITDGMAIPNTGIPGMEMGYTVERLLRAPADGHVTPVRQIGDHVETGDVVAIVNKCEVHSQIKGVLRGLIHPKVPVTKGLKIGDVDPRDERSHCFSITDKALAIAGGVLEAVMSFGCQEYWFTARRPKDKNFSS